VAQRGKSCTVLVADDDAEDRMLVAEAFAESHLTNNLRFVEDGEQLMDYLHQRGSYSDPTNAPRPGLILLDLNMPKKDGRKALQEIKSDPILRHIPVVVLTTSKAEQDVYRSYELGVNSFITKPSSWKDLVEMVATLGKYWLEISEPSPNWAKK